MSFISTHNAGVFSCCSIKLNDIINKNSTMPTYVNSSAQFDWYKQTNKDITYEYFEHYNNITINNPINYNHDDQFIVYLKWKHLETLFTQKTTTFFLLTLIM